MEAAVKKTVSGDVGALLLNLLMPPHEHDAHRLQQAMAVSLHGGVFMPAFTHIFVCVCVCAGFRYRRRDADRDLVSPIQKAA